MRYFCKYVVVVFLFSILSVSYSGSDFVIKFFDAGETFVSHRGFRVLRGEILDISSYMYGGKDYYIAYYLRASGRLFSYKYMSNGNVRFEDRFIYEGARLTRVKTYKDRSLVHITILYNDIFKTKRIYASDRSYIISYFRDDKQLRRVEKYDRGDRLVTYTTFLYDGRGRQVRVSYFTDKSELLGYIAYSYKGLLKFKKFIYDRDRRLVGYTSYIYNSSSLLVEARRYSASGNLLGYITYEYFDNGILRYKQYYDSGSRLVPR